MVDFATILLKFYTFLDQGNIFSCKLLLVVIEGVLISFSKVIDCLPLSTWEESLEYKNCSGADETLESKKEFEAERGSDEVKGLEIEGSKVDEGLELIKYLKRVRIVNIQNAGV
ncbi:15772_t:CDS:2 [Gigaspora margarita]|uniref:15772_t:CDS:1 n=1 Tax=Gigaspora margarita TaxID=4874 RepID=A0ABN7WCF5_GIGMA|nr:15772_t:CDS:2 [Gigaspora margarita]